MDNNKELDTPPPQYILNVCAAAELLSHSSSDSAEYKRAWLKEKLIRPSILSAETCPDACIRALSIALNHKEIASIMEVTGAIFTKKANAITRHEQKKNIVPCNIYW